MLSVDGPAQGKNNLKNDVCARIRPRFYPSGLPTAWNFSAANKTLLIGNRGMDMLTRHLTLGAVLSLYDYDVAATLEHLGRQRLVEGDEGH